MKREDLPALARPAGLSQDTDLVVRIARTEDHLNKARLIRHLAFVRVAPNYAAVVARPDPMDYDPHSVVFLAESRRSGLPVASIRIESGRSDHFYPTDHFPIPARIDRQASAYVTRLATQPGREGNRAATLVIKAAFRYCLAIELDWMIAVAVPPRDRHYKHYGLAPFPELPGLVPLPDNNHKQCRVMACQLFELEQAWRAAAHPMHAVMYGGHSPEIEVFDSVRGAWIGSRSDGGPPQASGASDCNIGLPIV